MDGSDVGDGSRRSRVPLHNREAARGSDPDRSLADPRKNWVDDVDGCVAKLTTEFFGFSILPDAIDWPKEKIAPEIAGRFFKSPIFSTQRLCCGPGVGFAS
jgi:hypothetical protein